MPTESPPATEQETWLDWLPERAPDLELGDLLSRDELLQELRDRGVDVNARTLASWEAKGTLPRAIRRWRDGAPAALYPVQAVGAVEHLRRLRAEGVPLQTIKPLVRSWFRTRLAYELITPEEIERNRERNRDHPWDMEEQLLAVATAHERRTGTKIVRVELRLFDEQGHPLTYSFPRDNGQ